MNEVFNKINFLIKYCNNLWSKLTTMIDEPIRVFETSV